MSRNLGRILFLLFLFCKKSAKAVLESDKLMLSKNEVFVRKGYGCDGMFKLYMSNINNNKPPVFCLYC